MSRGLTTPVSVLRNAMVMPNTRADWLIPSAQLIAPRPIVLWEYARESETIVDTAASLQRLFASAPTGALSPEALTQLIKNVRERLGFNRAIILLQTGVTEFSNIHGIEQIRFTNIKEAFGDVLATIRREFPNE